MKVIPNLIEEIWIKAHLRGIMSHLVCLKCFPSVFVIQFSSDFYCRLLFLLLSFFRTVFSRHSYVFFHHNKKNLFYYHFYLKLGIVKRDFLQKSFLDVIEQGTFCVW